MISKSLDYFRKLDIIGPQIGLEHSNSTRFKSGLGASISFLAIILCTVIAFMFGQEVYKREAPNLSISQELLENSNVKIQDLNMIFAISKFSGEIITNPFEYVQVKVSLFTIFVNQSSSLDMNSYSAINTNGAITLVTNSTTLIENDLYSIPSTTFRVHLTKCNSMIQTCAPDLEEIFNTLYFTLLLNSNYFSSLNYDNPLKTIMRTYGIPISDKLMKNIEISVLNNYLESDNGWILEDYVKFNSLSVLDPIIKYNFISNSESDDLIRFQFGAPRLITKTSRRYMKIQELFALIGGLISGISISTQITFYHYLRFKYLMHFYKVELNKDDLLNQLSSKSIVSVNNKSFLKIDNQNFSIENNINKKENFKMHSSNVLSINRLNSNYTNNRPLRNDSSNKNNETQLNKISQINQSSQFDNLIKLNNNNLDNNVSRLNSDKLKSNIIEKPNLGVLINKTDSNSINPNVEIASNSSYFGYIVSLLFCKYKDSKGYFFLIENVEKALDIKTYFSIIKMYFKKQF